MTEPTVAQHPETPMTATPAQTTPSPETRPSDFASIGDRLLAQLIDGLVVVGVFFFLGTALAPRFGGLTDTGFNLTGWPAAVVSIATAVVLFVYFVFMEGVLGVTLGKLVAGVRVQTAEGQRVGVRAAVIRNVLRIVDAIGVYLLGAFTILVTRRHQRLGDLAARSVVVRHEPGRVLRVVALLIALLLAGGGIAVGVMLRPPARQADQSAAGRQAAVGQPRFATVIVTDAVDGKAQRTVFTTDVPKIYVVFTLADVPEDTALKAIWLAENVQGLPPNDKFGEYELRAGGALDEGHFSLSRPAAGWRAGEYRVDLYLGGNLAQSVRFRLEGP